MIRYFFDTEFDTMPDGRRRMFSAAIARNDGQVLYLVEESETVFSQPISPWVLKNVVPILFNVPSSVKPVVVPYAEWGRLISQFIYRGDEVPQVFADWMSDIADLNEMFITGPGEGVPMSHQTHFCVLRHLDVYPTTLEGAVQHNAAWDVLALKRWLDEMEAK